MKYILVFVLLIFAGKLYAQVTVDEDLKPLLREKTKFREIKTTVNNFYNAKLAKLEPNDSIGKKRIMRKLKKWNRLFWISENYTNAAGEVIDGNALNYAAYKKRQQTDLANKTQTTLDRWTLQGPMNGDKGVGRIDRIAFHPTNPNILFAGSPHGGIFKTIDGGANWLPLGDFMPSLGVAGIAVNPTNPNIIYVLSGDGESADNSFVNQHLYRSASQGVFKTIDGGITWFKTSILRDTIYQAHQLIIDPVDPEILYATTSVGLFRTTNGGISWGNVQGAGAFFFEKINIWDVKLKPNDHNVVYISGNSSFYRLDYNPGQNLAGAAQTLIGGANRISIAVTPANPNRVVLLAGPVTPGGTSFRGVFSSNDAGKNFTLKTQTPNIFGNFIGKVDTADQTNYDNCIAISPGAENFITVGGLTIWNSADGGSTWSQVSAYWPADNPYMHPDIHYIGYSPLWTPSTNNKLYCGNDGGVYRQNGAAWDFWDFISNGLSTTQFFHFERENEQSEVWGAAQDNGILQQTDAFNGDYENYTTGDGYDVMTDQDYLVADGEGNNHFFSLNEKIYTDNCLVGLFSDCNITPAGNTEFFANLAMSPDLEKKIWAGYASKTLLSFSAGDPWEYSWPIPGDWCISTCRSNSNVAYAAGGGQLNRFLWGSNWTNLTTNMVQQVGYSASLKITDIDVKPTNENVVYISIAGNDSTHKVFKTMDGGVTWQNLSYNLPNVPIFSIKQDEFDGVYAGTAIGVYYKRSVATFWEPFYNSLPPVPVTEIRLYQHSGYNEVWVSTFGRGIWYTSPYPNCPVDATITGNVTAPFYQQASHNILSTQNVTNNVGTNVKYNAGNQIKLSPGFKVSAGSKFKTYTTGCGTLLAKYSTERVIKIDKKKQLNQSPQKK